MARTRSGKGKRGIDLSTIAQIEFFVAYTGKSYPEVIDAFVELEIRGSHPDRNFRRELGMIGGFLRKPGQGPKRLPG